MDKNCSPKVPFFAPLVLALLWFGNYGNYCKWLGVYMPDFWVMAFLSAFGVGYLARSILFQREVMRTADNSAIAELQKWKNAVVNSFFLDGPAFFLAALLLIFFPIGLKFYPS